MKIYSLSDFAKILKDQKYKHIGLFDANDKQIVTFNSTHKTSVDRLDDIKTRLGSPALSDGFYVIKCKNYVGRAEPTDNFTITKGNPKEEELPKGIEVKEETKESLADNVLSYESALELNNRLNRLELENEQLKKDNEALEAELEEEPEDEPEEENELAENAKTYISQLAEMFIPILNTHYEQADRKLKMDELRLVNQVQGQPMQIQANGGHQAPEPPAPELSEEEEAQFMEELKELAETDPEAYRAQISKMMNQ